MLVLLFAQCPRFVLDNVFIDGGDQRPREFQSTRKLLLLKELVELAYRVLRQRGNHVFGAGVGRASRWIGNFAVEITSDHRKGATSKISQSVDEIGIVALRQ